MAERNATAAVIGAGDYIGAAIAKKFAAEGFTVFAGRRNATSSRRWSRTSMARRQVVARALDARKEEDITRSCKKPTPSAP